MLGLTVCLLHVVTGVDRQAAMEAQSIWERLSRALGDAAESSVEALQPVAEAVAAALGIKGPPVSLFAEEVVRGTTAAALAQLLSAFIPRCGNAMQRSIWLHGDQTCLPCSQSVLPPAAVKCQRMHMLGAWQHGLLVVAC